MSNTQSSDHKKWRSGKVWRRGLAMLFFGFIAGFARVGLTFVAIFQFLSLLFTAKPNGHLVAFGQSLNTYLYQINQFLTVNSEQYPFPFSRWPTSTPDVVASQYDRYAD